MSPESPLDRAQQVLRHTFGHEAFKGFQGAVVEEVLAGRNAMAVLPTGGGKIHEIEASGFINAYMAPTGWDAEYPETYKYAVTHPHTHPHQAGTTSKW